MLNCDSMDLANCPWPAATQLPQHYCEENLCAWVVQPINTWSNLGYLVVAFFILTQKNWNQDRYWFAFLSLLLFAGSTLYHMTGTYWGRDLDVGAMLLLSGFVLCLTLTRHLNLSRKYLTILVPVVASSSVLSIGTGWGGRVFVIQVLATALAEWNYAHKVKLPRELKKNLLHSLLLFLFALVLNILDMKRIYCLPKNDFINLHAIWHLLCAYCIFLIVKYYCFIYKTEPIVTDKNSTL